MLLQHLQAVADSNGEIDWEASVDSTTARAHQRAAGALKAPPRSVDASKGAQNRMSVHK
jgi:hypothetical protein